jgi:hypothetical protein
VIEIESKMSLDEVVRRLQTLIPSTRSAGLTSAAVIGCVTESQFELMRFSQYANSYFRPRLSGQLVSTATGTKLIGDFSFSQRAKSIFKLQLVSFCIWILVATAAALWFARPIYWCLPAAGVGGLMIAVAIPRFARSYYAEDEDWLLRLLSDELRGIMLKRS